MREDPTAADLSDADVEHLSNEYYRAGQAALSHSDPDGGRAVGRAHAAGLRAVAAAVLASRAESLRALQREREDPIPRAYAGRDDVAEAHDEVIGAGKVDPRAPVDERQARAMAQVCLDLHDALGVPWGHDPYAAIRQMGAERDAALAVATGHEERAREAERRERAALDALAAARAARPKPFAACPDIGDTGLDPLPPP